MKRINILWLAFALYACMVVRCKANTLNDTLTVRPIHESTSDTISLVEIDIDYPVGGPQVLTDSIRAYISNTLHSAASVGDIDGKTTLPKYQGNLQDGERMAKFYARQCFETLKSNEDNIMPGMKLEQSIGFEKRYENKQILTLLQTGYTYLGGAHGLSFCRGAMFDKTTGILIKDYIVDTTKVEQLQPLMEKGLKTYFRDNQVEPEANIKDMLQLNSDQIPLPADNPFFTKEGVTFVYSEYEIGAYAIGMPRFTIPYKEIYPYLTPQAKLYLNSSSPKQK